jgi:hypothetical protein
VWIAETGSSRDCLERKVRIAEQMDGALRASPPDCGYDAVSEIPAKQPIELILGEPRFLCDLRDPDRIG